MRTVNKKLDIILTAIKEAWELTPKGQPMKVYLAEDNDLINFNIEELNSILLKLQNDEKILKIIEHPGFPSRNKPNENEVENLILDWLMKYGEVPTPDEILTFEQGFDITQNQYFLIDIFGDFEKTWKKYVSPTQNNQRAMNTPPETREIIKNLNKQGVTKKYIHDYLEHNADEKKNIIPLDRKTISGIINQIE